jgi:ABC-type branched-subunit amino acid transport system ATPase component
MDGKPAAKPTPSTWLRAGGAYVPQGHRVFTDLAIRAVNYTKTHNVSYYMNE